MAASRMAFSTASWVGSPPGGTMARRSFSRSPFFSGVGSTSPSSRSKGLMLVPAPGRISTMAPPKASTRAW